MTEHQCSQKMKGKREIDPREVHISFPLSVNDDGAVRSLPENSIEVHMVPRTPDIKITVKMTKQQINKELIRVDLIEPDNEQQSLFYVTSVISSRLLFLFLGSH